MPALIYSGDIREALFNPLYLADRGRTVAREAGVPQGRSAHVVKVKWKTGLRRGTEIQGGEELATIQWSVGREDPLTAPPGCSGVIQKVNRDIKYEGLTQRPAEFALILR